jgi:hypothetical protein
MEKIKIKVSELVTKNGWSEDRFKEYLEMEIELDLIK